MRVRTYDASDGDCLLVTSNDGIHALFDGGRKGSFEDNTLDDLGSLEGPIDLVCVSHVDNDHIQGIVKLFDIRIAHAVHDHQAPTNPNSRPPNAPRVEVAELWHNSFDELSDDRDGAIANALVSHHRILSHFVHSDGTATDLWHTAKPNLSDGADGHTATFFDDLARSDRFATGFLEGIELTRKAELGALGVQLNHDFRRMRPPLVKRPGRRRTNDDIPVRALGEIDLHVLAPTHQQLKDFSGKWHDWAEDNAHRIADLAEEIESLLLTAEAGHPRMVEIARRSAVTPQNLVSIVVLAEEGDHTVLLTGDSHQDDIIDGLAAADRLVDHIPGAPSGIHVDVLKVQHHGSPNNLDADFVRRVSADHYLLCGNGAHLNPSFSVIDHIIDSRVLPAGHAERAATPQVDDPFHLWFTAHPDRIESPDRGDHMASLLAHVRRRIADHPGRFGATVLNGTSFDIIPGVTPVETTFREVT